MKVLVVECYAPLREVIVLNLIDENPSFEVLQADSVESALKQIKENLPDAVASCIYMNMRMHTHNDLNGVDLLRFIQNQHPSIKVILFSNFIGEDFRADDLMRRGAYAAIPKSIEIAEHLSSAFKGMFSF